MDGWLLADDSRRPFPQDIEMRCGFLGQLTSGNKLSQLPTVHSVEGEEMQPPPEKKFALNQNLNNSENGVSQQFDMTTTSEVH